MKRMMTILALTLTTSLYAETEAKIDVDTCKKVIVFANKVLGNEMTVDSFSSETFDQQNLTVTEFNSLTTEQQVEIYNKIKSLKVQVIETITELNSFFNAYAGTPIERQYQDLFASLRNQRAYLRYKCLE